MCESTSVTLDLGVQDQINLLPDAHRKHDRVNDRLTMTTTNLKAELAAARVNPARIGNEQAQADTRWKTIEANIRLVECDLN